MSKKPVAVEVDSETMFDVVLIVGASVGAYFLWEYFSSKKTPSGGDNGGDNGGTLEPLSPVNSPPPTKKPPKQPPTIVSQPKGLQGPYSAPGVTFCTHAQVLYGPDSGTKIPYQLDNFNPPTVVHGNTPCNVAGPKSVAFEGQWMNGQWQGKFIDPNHWCSRVVVTPAGGIACDANSVTKPWPVF